MSLLRLHVRHCHTGNCPTSPFHFHPLNICLNFKADKQKSWRTTYHIIDVTKLRASNLSLPTNSIGGVHRKTVKWKVFIYFLGLFCRDVEANSSSLVFWRANMTNWHARNQIQSRAVINHRLLGLAFGGGGLGIPNQGCQRDVFSALFLLLTKFEARLWAGHGPYFSGLFLSERQYLVFDFEPLKQLLWIVAISLFPREIWHPANPLIASNVTVYYPNVIRLLYLFFNVIYYFFSKQYTQMPTLLASPYRIIRACSRQKIKSKTSHL